MWIGFYVPHRVRHRQQLVDARTEDRFSGSLRVLAVAGPGSAGAPVRWGLAMAGPTADAGDLPGTSRPSLAAAPHDQDQRGTHEEGQRDMSTSTIADPAGRVRPRTGAPERPSSSRLAVLERRAAAARRRLALTAVLLLASVAAWTAFGTSLVVWWVAVLPTALLAVVLVLGRRAVLSAQRSDAAWAAERRAAARAARGTALGSPPAPRGARPRVTGHAVRGSQTSTQMIPRVTAADLAAAAAARTADGSTSADGARQAVPEARETSERSGAREHQVARRDAQVPDETRAANVADPSGGAGEPEVAGPTTPSGRAWDPVPVPAPTYTMKPAAPRREPAPLPPEETAQPAPSDRSVAASSVPAGRVDEGSVAEDAKKPTTETLGLDLNEILARRRVAGE